MRACEMLASACHRHAEQECDKQARERGFPRNGADRGKRLSRLPRGCDRLAQSLDGGLKACGNFRDRARYICGGIDRAFRHTGL
jgi:hypothetical protein